MDELENWRVLVGLLPFNWEQLGRSSGAVRRLRGFSSLESLLHTLLLHVGCGWSLRETVVQAKLAGLAEVSDVTLLNRLRDAEGWFRQLREALYRAADREDGEGGKHHFPLGLHRENSREHTASGVSSSSHSTK